MQKAFAVIALFIFLINLSCKKNPVEPNDKLNNRNYIWKIDTLKINEGIALPSFMWGTDPDNLWAVGYAFSNKYCIWYYNGVKWNNYQPDKYVDPWGIYGFAKNDIWMGSSDGFIWHYNGIKWSRFFEVKIPGYTAFVPQGICGSGPSDIFAVGYANKIDGHSYKPIIVHYDGTLWSLIDTPLSNESLVQIFYLKNEDKYLLHSWIFDSPEQMIYLFDGQKLEKIFTVPAADLCIGSIGEDVYITSDSKIYKYGNGSLTFFKAFPDTQFVGRVWGRNENDFFCLNGDGIGHYDGSNLITIFKKANNDWFLNEAIVFEKEVFFIWDESMQHKTVIVHGKLK